MLERSRLSLQAGIFIRAIVISNVLSSFRWYVTACEFGNYRITSLAKVSKQGENFPVDEESWKHSYVFRRESFEDVQFYLSECLCDIWPFEVACPNTRPISAPNYSTYRKSLFSNSVLSCMPASLLLSLSAGPYFRSLLLLTTTRYAAVVC